MTEKKDMVKDAKALAMKLHIGMTDKYGNPYFEHLERVANRVREMEYDMVDETSEINLYIAAAYLHDVIEDTDYRIADIMAIFGETIAEAVKLLTRGEEETYADYVIGIKKSVYIEGKIARVVKMADLLDHLMGPTPCPPHLIKRYEKSLYSLMGKL
jgi:(p)ppGpp synthase/HD superfamily hydrolase